MKLYAHCSSMEFVDSPSYLMVDDAGELLQEARRLQRVCEIHALDACQASWYIKWPANPHFHGTGNWAIDREVIRVHQGGWIELGGEFEYDGAPVAAHTSIDELRDAIINASLDHKDAVFINMDEDQLRDYREDGGEVIEEELEDETLPG